MSLAGICLTPIACELFSKHRFNKAKPIISINIQDLGANKIYVCVESIKNKHCEIDKIFFSLDLPGTLDSFKLRTQQRVGTYSYNKRHRKSIDNDTISEAVYFELTDFYPKGYFDGYIHYKAPKERIEKCGKEIVYFSTPYLDLQDYLLYTIVYTYNGTTQTINDTLSLRDIAFIKQDIQRRKNQCISKTSIKNWINNNKSDSITDDFIRYINNGIQHYVRNRKKYNNNDTFEIYYRIDTTLSGVNDTAFSCNIIYITNDTLFNISNFYDKWIFEHHDSYRKNFKKHLDL